MSNSSTAAGFVHYSYMVIDSVGKCEFPCWKISCARVSSETYIPLLEPPQGCEAHRHRAGIHIWASLLEVDIVLLADMPLQQAHDIGESLQGKLELLLAQLGGYGRIGSFF